MFDLLKSLFIAPAASSEAARPTVPEGEIVYAIGDVHGCADLLRALRKAIEKDLEQRPDLCVTILMLGDLVDRGPDSAGVVRQVRKWQRRSNVRVLAGNHEEMFLASFSDTDILRQFLRHGGRETLLSYGILPKSYRSASVAEVQAMMNTAIPQQDRDFIAGFEDMVIIGDYAFVHAGIDPAAPLDQQMASHLRWIREPFLSCQSLHEKVIVHGHTIAPEPQDRGNRIGLDTGAYVSGRLTALVLHGTERRYIEVFRSNDGDIAVRHFGRTAGHLRSRKADNVPGSL